MWWLLMTAHAMPLVVALDAAEQRSPIAELATQRVAEAQARVNETRGRLLPTATLSGAAVLQNEVTVNFADNLPPLPLLDPTQFTPLVIQPGFQLQGAAEVVQPILAPQAWAGGSAAREGVELARAEKAQTQAAVRKAVLQSWHSSAEAHALVQDATVGVELAERLLQRAQSLVDNGVASPDQLLPFRRALASSQANLAMAQAGSVAADGVLEQLTGIPGGAEGSQAPTAAPELDGLLGGIERSDLETAKARVKTAGAARKLEQWGLLPTVAAKAGVYLVDPAPDLGEPLNWRISIGATIPIFQGGSTRARITGAGARVAQAQAANRALDEQARIEVRAAHGELSRSLAALSAREEALDLAEQAVKAAEARSDAGGGSLFAIQQAQAEELGARAELTRARSAAARAADGLSLAVRDRP